MFDSQKNQLIKVIQEPDYNDNAVNLIADAVDAVFLSAPATIFVII